MDRHVGNYVVKITENPGPGPLNGLAILHYAGAMNPTLFRTMVRIKNLNPHENY